VGIQSLKTSGINNFVRSRSMLVGNEAFEPSSFDLISTTILDSTQSSVVFDVSTYASTYKHLQVRLVGRSSEATTSIYDLLIRFNGDIGSNYSGHNLRGTGSAVQSNALIGFTYIINESTFVGNSNTANIFGSAVIDILDPFSTTKNTTTRSIGGHNSSTARLYLGSGAYYSTEAVNSITVGPTFGSILAGSRFSLYGIRG
jgi:hypothetical protein